MNLRSHFLIFALFALIFSIGAGVAHAQGISGVGIELVPSLDTPSPGQEISITARSYATNINGASLTWVVGGKTVAKGVGITSIKVTTPAMGKSLTVSVTAVLTNGNVLESSLVLRPSSVDLIVETDGYVPPGFKGKTPVAYQNAVKIIAIPHLTNSEGTEYDPASLVYSWDQGASAIEAQSGYGKQSIIIPNSEIPRSYVVTVTVTNRDGTARAMGIVEISPQNPGLNFYVNDPLYGPLFNSEIGATVYLGSQREKSVMAVPFGFNLPERGLGDVSLFWSINGTARPELSLNRTVTLRAPDNSSGSSVVELSLTNEDNIAQRARRGFSVVFTSE